MDIKDATVDKLLQELRSRNEVIAVKCWVLNDLNDWIDKEIQAALGRINEDHSEYVKLLRERRETIVRCAADNLSTLDGHTAYDLGLIDSAMTRVISDIREEV